MPDYHYGAKYPQAARSANEWPYGNESKHAAAARKGWETRRANAKAQGIAIGDTTKPKQGRAAQPAKSKTAPVATRDVRRKGEQERRAKYFQLVTVEHVNASEAARLSGGAVPPAWATEAKARAGWYYEQREQHIPGKPFPRLSWVQVPYSKKKRG